MHNTPEDVTRFQAMLAHLSLMYPNHNVPLKELFRDYFTDLQPYTIEQVQQIFLLARQTYAFFPNTAQLLTIARRLFDETAPRLPPNARALQAWHRLRTLGGKGYREDALDDPMTHHCFEAMGGRSGFGTWNYDHEEGFMRKYFCDLYATYAEQDDQWVSRAEARKILHTYGLSGFLGTDTEHDDDELTPRD